MYINDMPAAMTGATSSANGTKGYINVVPPKSGYNKKFWRADGTWTDPVGYVLSKDVTYTKHSSVGTVTSMQCSVHGGCLHFHISWHQTTTAPNATELFKITSPMGDGGRSVRVGITQDYVCMSSSDGTIGKLTLSGVEADGLYLTCAGSFPAGSYYGINFDVMMA